MPCDAERFPSDAALMPLYVKPSPTGAGSMQSGAERFLAATDKVQLMDERFPSEAEWMPGEAERLPGATDKVQLMADGLRPPLGRNAIEDVLHRASSWRTNAL